jgi:hypothetical protein
VAHLGQPAAWWEIGPACDAASRNEEVASAGDLLGSLVADGGEQKSIAILHVTLLRCMSQPLARNGPPARSAVRSLTGGNRTWRGRLNSVRNDPARAAIGADNLLPNTRVDMVEDIFANEWRRQTHELTYNYGSKFDCHRHVQLGSAVVAISSITVPGVGKAETATHARTG